MPHTTDARSKGKVRSFSPEKGYGFIQGDDGKSYFVHSTQIEGGGHLVDGQTVSFSGEPTPKGYKATNVVPGELPPPLTKVYSHPNDFVWLKGEVPKGLEYVFEIKRALWAKSNDPNVARFQLIQMAKSFGANALVNVQMLKLTEQDGCSNYRYTVHAFTGDAGCVMRVSMSRDPDAIAASEHWYQEMSERIEALTTSAQGSSGRTDLIPPGTLKLVTTQLISWIVTGGKIIFLSAKYLIGKAIAALEARRTGTTRD